MVWETNSTPGTRPPALCTYRIPYRMEIIEDKDEGGFVVSYPDLPGCMTCGETIETAAANALDAKKRWLEAALEQGIEIHEPGSGKQSPILPGRTSHAFSKLL